MKNKFVAIKTTYPNSAKGKTLAKNLAKVLLNQKLAACVQFLPIESVYVWEGKIKNEHEILVSIKSKNSLYKKIEKTIKEHHIYEIPQIFSTQIDRGLMPYLNWIDSITQKRK
jgi:periplasmic divalent cation tolerance protein